MTSIEVFISYHQKDEDFREELEKHLTSLRREQTIISWSDRQIVAGQEFKGEIDKSLNQAGLILLLVSPDFIASHYHWTVEVTRALEQNAAGKASVIPVLLRYADWETPPIDELSPLPKNRKPIKSWNDRDEAFLEVVKGIREAIAQLVASPNYSSPQQTPQELDYRQYQVTRLINEADRLREGKKFEEAVLIYKVVLSLDPNSVLAHKNLGIALYYQDKFDEAIASFRKALQIDPNYTDAHNALGNALSAQGKLDEAITSYRKALQIDPNYPNAHNNLGIALYKQGKLDEAIASFRKVLQIDPNYPNAHNNLGSALKNQGKLEEAIAELEIAVRLDPSSTLYSKNLENYKNKKKGF
ncbi:tetratricopeptide repeat protein [Brasilonema sp. CT11]|nr:tetratricopeptide repeat protein [Brasilonema sp. CT11]